MANTIMEAHKKTETAETTSKSVSCNGGLGATGHPKVYLEIKPGENSVTCPYCSKEFVLKES